MKKTILTALTVIGMTTGAQAQQLGDNPTEFTNSFASIGAFNYVQKQSDGELNKWFLSGKNGKDKCFTTVKTYTGEPYCRYSETRAVEIINNKKDKIDDMQLCMVLEIGDYFTDSENINDNTIQLSYIFAYYGDSVYTNYKVSVRRENGNSVKEHESNAQGSTLSSLLNGNDNMLLDKEVKKIERGYFPVNYSFEFKVKDSKYICIQFDCGDKIGKYYITDIKITGTNGKTSTDENYNEYFTKSWFNESLTLIHYDTNGGNNIDDMYCYYEFSGERYNSWCEDNNEWPHFIIFNKLGEKIGEGWYKYMDRKEWNYNSDKIEWVDGFYPTTTRDGYKFTGWQFDDRGSVSDDFDFRTKGLKYNKLYSDGYPLCSPFMGDMTLVAQWEQIGEGGSTEPNPGVVTAINSEIAQTYYSNGVLRTAGAYDISVYNASGVLVKAAHNVSELDLSELKSGLYIARVNGETIKFVK